MFFQENDQIELKEIYIPDVKKEVIAFVNTRGGTVFIGVADDGTVVGVEKLDDTILAMNNALRDSIRPDVTMITKTEILKFEEKFVIKLVVEEGGSKPYYLREKGMNPKGVYVRHGTSSVPASQSVIRTMIKNTDGDSFESHRTLHENLTFLELSQEMEHQELEFGEIQMENLGLRSKDGEFTNLALILSDQCPYSIKIAKFQDETKQVFLDRDELTGSVFSQLREALKIINYSNATTATFDDDLYRKDKISYPKVAIREALLNAVVHRDYNFSAGISVNIFSNRIEIISLGGLVDGLSIKSILRGATQPRNEKLANMFYRLELIESYGIGIGRILDSYDGCQYQPTFEDLDGAFCVTLPQR